MNSNMTQPDIKLPIILWCLIAIISINLAWAHQTILIKMVDIINYYNFNVEPPFSYRILPAIIYRAIFFGNGEIKLGLNEPLSSSYQVFQLILDSVSLWLNLDSSQFGQLGNQQFQQGSEQAFAPDADVMDELKEAQVKRQFFLRDAPMGSQPGAQQRPEALGGVDVNLMEAVSVFIAGVLAPAVAHGTVVKTPFRQTVVDVVFIGMNLCTRRDEPLDQRTDRDLLDIVQHPHDDGTASLDHAEDRWLFAFQRAAPPRPFQAPPPASPTLFFTASGCPLWPATTYTSSHSTSPARTGSGWRTTIPSRNCSVIRCTSSGFKLNSWAIWRLDRFNPMKYKHKIHTRNG